MTGQSEERHKPTPDLVATIGTRSTRTPEPDAPLVEKREDHDIRAIVDELTGKDTNLSTVTATRLRVIDDLLIRCLKAGQEAPAGSIARTTLLEVAGSLARDQMRQNRMALSGKTAIQEISRLIDESLAAAAAAAGGDRILKATLIGAASSFSNFLSLGAIAKEEGYETR